MRDGTLQSHEWRGDVRLNRERLTELIAEETQVVIGVWLLRGTPRHHQVNLSGDLVPGAQPSTRNSRQRIARKVVDIGLRIFDRQFF